MSEGPIKMWRDSWKPTIVSTTDAARTCAASVALAGRSYCGRKGFRLVPWDAVTCADCHAARRADVERGKG